MRTSWVTDLTQAQVRTMFGAPVALQGWDIAFRNNVTAITSVSDGEGSLVGTVHDGTDSYRTVVSARRVPGGVSVSSSCTCPAASMCKHAAAVIFATQRDQPAASGVSDWRRQLDRVLRAGGPVPPAVTTEVGVQFDVRSGRAGLAVALRPVRRNGRGRWVRSGLSWADLARPDLALPAAHRDALLGLFELARATGTAGDRPIHLHQFGDPVWASLARVHALGIPLLGSGAVSHVRLEPARAQLIVQPDPEDDQSGVVLTVAVQLGEIMADAAQPVGQPAHGAVAIHQNTLLLGGFGQPPVAAVDELFRAGRPIRIPPADVPRFLVDYAPRLRETVPDLAMAADLQTAQPQPPQLVVETTYAAEHSLEVIWLVAYRVGDNVLEYQLRDDHRSSAREPAAEWQLERAVVDLDTVVGVDGLTMATDTARVLVPEVRLGPVATARFVDTVLPRLREMGEVEVRVHGDLPDYRQAGEAAVVQVSATESAGDPDWFDLRIEVSVDEQPVPLESLLRALAAGEEHLVLAGGLYLSLDRPQFRRLRELIDEARGLVDVRTGIARATPLQAGWWADLVALGVPGEQSQRWQDAVAVLLGDQQHATVADPVGLKATLRPYQGDGYAWLGRLWDLHLGGVLADDMGLGKTLQTLAMVQRAKEDGTLPDPVLVVAPTSVMSTWVQEADRFTPDLKVVAVTETNRRRAGPLAAVVAGADLVVTSYTLLRIDAGEYRQLPWRGMVLDEAQFVKNHQSKTYQVARRTPAPFKLAITGTPLENSLMDLWSQLSIVAPGLFPDPEEFAEVYRRPIENDGDTERLDLLRRRLRPLMLRRTKSDVATELPPKQEQVLTVALYPQHRSVYDTHLTRERSTVLGLIQDLSTNRMHVLAALTRLRQLSLAAGLVDDRYADLASAKIDALVEHVQELAAEGHRALVFSQFTTFLRMIRDRLSAEGIDSGYLDGTTRNRAAVLDGFRAGNQPVFLISLKAGGFGLNLTEADYVFVMDPWWNPAAEQQAVDRTHRIGQHKTVMVYRMVSADTVEEKVVELQRRKRELFRTVIDDAQLSVPALSAQDFRDLLG
ncbi:MAG: helicase SNF2 [Micrococcales bacterium]|nr:MAG: helicase SNF2 [Micrococcales bacterium]PIE25782.1 MAG: helicase SNF2 [Micrococcales bacterium]PIE28085.1 MAG: helicase SNF2 [Micrococcales bacterium]